MTVSNDVVHDPRVLKEAHALQEAGHGVSIIGWDRSGTAKRREELNGLHIYRVRTDGVMRVLPKDMFRLPLWWRRARALARSIPFDVVHSHDLDTLPIGVRLKKATGRPLIYDAHEVFEDVIEGDVPQLVIDITHRLELRLAPQADRVITVTDGVKKHVDRVSGKEAVIVRNCHDLYIDAYRPPPAYPFTVLYIGVLHPSRFITQAIDVIGGMPDVRLPIAGAGQLTRIVQAMCAEHPNTNFLGLVPLERVLPMTLDSHAVLIMSDPTLRLSKIGLSNKMFDAMVTGRPVIVTKGVPMGDIVTHEECGIAVPYTKEGFRSAVERLRDDPALAERMGRNGLAAAKREYNWGAEKKKLLAVYESLPGR